MIPACGCPSHRPTVGQCFFVATAALAGVVLTGLVAAVTLVWRATDVDLPTDDELRGLLLEMSP